MVVLGAVGAVVVVVVGDPQTKSYTGKDQPDRVPDVVRGSGGVRLYDGKIVMESPVALMSRGLNIPFGTQLE